MLAKSSAQSRQTDFAIRRLAMYLGTVGGLLIDEILEMWHLKQVWARKPCNANLIQSVSFNLRTLPDERNVQYVPGLFVLPVVYRLLAQWQKTVVFGLDRVPSSPTLVRS